MTRAGERSAKRARRVPAWVEVPLLAAFALGLALLVKTFLAQMFFVPSASMEPTLVTDDKLFVEKVSLWGDGEVERGDVVVFRDPGGWLGAPPRLNAVQQTLSTIGLYPSGGHLVKRVVGVGGDTVVCCDDDDRITVNGRPLDERYLPDGVKPSTMTFEVEVPAGRLWVMGDNRGNSQDSRYHQRDDGNGTVPEADVVGRVWAVVWPWSRWDHLETPSTYADVGRAD